MEGVQVYMQETELSKRVQQWEDKIRPILTAEVTHGLILQKFTKSFI